MKRRLILATIIAAAALTSEKPTAEKNSETSPSVAPVPAASAPAIGMK